ncbi:hypothetical protein K431DRAFT_171207 [Polychaeton citri CBS 116435]|uniref:Uncharacterized protein n=1 Tax=Polychaeton citri CBS 116435 TaxID=1314669 RepID=A0A9P4UKH3_9PEZI|nr:hypothetical protein K431DRAFT_171207 [Polychaeton citri CBS 116435]
MKRVGPTPHGSGSGSCYCVGDIAIDKIGEVKRRPCQSRLLRSSYRPALGYSRRERRTGAQRRPDI